jgi:hypothetical protein
MTKAFVALEPQNRLPNLKPKSATAEPHDTFTTLTTVIKIEVFVTVRAFPGQNVVTNAVEVASP